MNNNIEKEKVETRSGRRIRYLYLKHHLYLLHPLKWQFKGPISISGTPPVQKILIRKNNIANIR